MVKGFVALNILRGLEAFMRAANLGNWECKTIGNAHPDGLHCFACTFNDIKERVERAVQFWSEGKRAERSLS
jgi:hypothetical protein